MTQPSVHAEGATSWPFTEAKALRARLGGKAPDKGYVLLETGYGPSGLPHIGTFGEVARTAMVRHAFSLLSAVPTRLYAFSDDMDGLRAVPDTVPPHRRQEFERFVDKPPDVGGVPLTSLPDPYGDCHASYGEHNNAKLREFLDTFGFAYEFQSATENYKGGRFDASLRKVLEHYDAIHEIAVRTVGEERRRNYGLFLPLVMDKDLGLPRFVYVKPKRVDPASGTIDFVNPLDGRLEERFPVTGGRCKLLWRIDWAMRWHAFDVDYEMSGKDLIESVKLSSVVRRILGGRPPERFTYELFLDEKGGKISKSKGNGLSVEEWLRYGPPESLSLFMYQKPKTAKRLFFDVIPKTMDEYLALLAKYAEQPEAERRDNPVWHIHAGAPPADVPPLSFGMLLNLASVCHAEDKAVLWQFISRYRPGANAKDSPLLDRLVGHAIRYYQDFVKPAKRYRPPTEMERQVLEDLAATLEKLPAGADAEAIQTEVYEVGKRHAFADLRSWFKALYEILLGQPEGPRMGSFIALYGRAETVALIRRALRGEPLDAR